MVRRMASNKKPRKKYVPKYEKGALPLTIRHDHDSERALMLFPHQAVDAFINGTVQEADWHTIVARLNVGQVLAHRHFNEEARAACREALDAMVKVRDRFLKLEKWGMTGDEYRLVSYMLTLTDEMQEKVTRRQLAAAINRVFAVAGVYKLKGDVNVTA